MTSSAEGRAVEHVQVRSDRGGAVREIVLNRPDKRNALSPAMFDALIEAFEVEAPAEERVTVVRGEGRVFCAGVDLAERIENGWPQQSPLVRLCELMRNYPLPILAAMQGDAIAGGAMLLLHCDLIVAAEGARLGMPLAQLGIAPPWIMTRRTVDRAGPALSRDMLLLGHPISAHRLYEHNVVNALVPRHAFDAEVDRVIDQLVVNAPLSLRAVKGALTSINELGVNDGHAYEESLVRAALDSQDAREGMRARLEHRRPTFTGS
jgi:enoyl-CoA hydratase/carnithine racemase